MIHCTDFNITNYQNHHSDQKNPTMIVKTPHFPSYCNFESFQFLSQCSFSNALNILQNQKLLELNASITHNLVIRSCHESLVIHPQPTECHLLIVSVPCYKEKKGKEILNWFHSPKLRNFKAYFCFKKGSYIFNNIIDSKC